MLAGVSQNGSADTFQKTLCETNKILHQAQRAPGKPLHKGSFLPSRQFFVNKYYVIHVMYIVNRSLYVVVDFNSAFYKFSHVYCICIAEA